MYRIGRIVHGRRRPARRSESIVAVSGLQDVICRDGSDVNVSLDDTAHGFFSSVVLKIDGTSYTPRRILRFLPGSWSPSNRGGVIPSP